MKRLFSKDEGMRKYSLAHFENGIWTQETRQDCEPIVEFCKAAKDKPSDPTFKHVAEIPMTVIGQWMREGSLDDETNLKRWLNDPANRDFRIWEGRI